MIEITVRLQDKLTGCLSETVRGLENKSIGDPVWITSALTFATDGLAIHAFKVVPTLHAYKGVVEFVIWDKRLRAKPKMVGTLTINCDTHEYTVALEQYYQRRPLLQTMHLHSNPVQPPSLVAFNNDTHHGDWAFKDTI